MRTKPFITTCIAILVMLTAFKSAQSASSTAGTVTTQIDHDSGAYRLIVQDDGKLLVAGISGPDIDSSKIALARYQEDGSLDRSFGQQGTVITDFGGYSLVGGLLQQHDGKILVLGSRQLPSLDENLILVRYNADGTTDSSFGEVGKINLESQAIDLHGVVLLPNDQFVAGALTYNGQTIEMAALHFLSNGSLQPLLNDRPKFSHFERDLSNADILLQPDGKIVLVGGIVASESQLLVVRFLPDGSKDPSFGEAGVVHSTFGLKSFAVEGAALQPDGKIVLAGTGSENHGVFAVARLTANGRIDPDFGAGGKTTLAVGQSASAVRVVIKRDGRIVAVGSSEGARGGNPLVIAQFKTNGQTDSAFGDQGLVLMGGDRARAYDVAVLPDGKIITVGEQSNGGSSFHFYLVKLNADGTPDERFGRNP